MTNEVKEILAYFEKYIKITYMHDSEPMLNWKDLKIGLDYITNLQEENKRLKEEIVKLMFDKSILQERLDKVIEIIKLCDTPCAKEVLQILQGEDNEN